LTIALLFLLCALLFAQNNDFLIVPDDIEVRLFPILQESGEMIFQNYKNATADCGVF
jgi:hypothetical protein